jgi:XTP/dITP diphosphohydrolase
MHKILIATGNSHKTEEFRQLLGPGWIVEDLKQHSDLISPEETGATFAENAAIKALAASTALGADWMVLADDSGLEVDALEGAPGVYSARFAGEGATDAENRTKLKTELLAKQVGHRESTGRFRCTLVLAKDGEVLLTVDGAVEGTLGLVESGSGGFGYDSLFYPNGFAVTFSEISAVEKNALSHRGKAMAKLLEKLPEFQVG